MQTVYEDGPKRDRRLWLGDLYLESLANAKTFKNFNLTKRCLYLFAATSGEDGFVYPCCFEKSLPHSQKSDCVSYSLLFNNLDEAGGGVDVGLVFGLGWWLAGVWT